MILHFFIAALAVSIIVTYWVVCRKIAYKYQHNAAVLIEQYFESNNVNDRDSESIYKDYRLFRKCYMMPIICFATPFYLLYTIIIKGSFDFKPEPRNNQKLHDKAYDQIMKMAIAKNPLISIISLSFAGVCLLVATTIGILFNKISSIRDSEDLSSVIRSVILNTRTSIAA